jgi:hypothetical protein
VNVVTAALVEAEEGAVDLIVVAVVLVAEAERDEQ